MTFMALGYNISGSMDPRTTEPQLLLFDISRKAKAVKSFCQVYAGLISRRSSFYAGLISRRSRSSLISRRSSFRLFLFVPPENIRNPLVFLLVFLCFQRDQKGRMGRNRLTKIFKVNQNFHKA